MARIGVNTGTPNANNNEVLLENVGTAVEVGASGATNGYWPSFSTGNDGNKSFLINTAVDEHRIWPVRAGMDLDEDTESFLLPTTGEDTVLVDVGYRAGNGWVAVGIASDTAADTGGGEGKFFVWISRSGTSGDWSLPQEISIDFVNYTPNGTSYLANDPEGALGDSYSVIFLGGASTPDKWGLVAANTGSRVIMYTFNASG